MFSSAHRTFRLPPRLPRRKKPLLPLLKRLLLLRLPRLRSLLPRSPSRRRKCNIIEFCNVVSHRCATSETAAPAEAAEEPAKPAEAPKEEKVRDLAVVSISDTSSNYA